MLNIIGFYSLGVFHVWLTVYGLGLGVSGLGFRPFEGLGFRV